MFIKVIMGKCAWVKDLYYLFIIVELLDIFNVLLLVKKWKIPKKNIKVKNIKKFEHGCFSFCLDIMLSVDFLKNRTNFC